MIDALLPLRGRVPGVASARVEDLGGRPAVVVRTDPSTHRGAISFEDGETIALAAELALDQRVPLVAVLSTAGADVTDRIAALHGWGRGARAFARCAGNVPVVAIVTGAAVSGPALLLG